MSEVRYLRTIDDHVMKVRKFIFYFCMAWLLFDFIFVVFTPSTKTYFTIFVVINVILIFFSSYVPLEYLSQKTFELVTKYLYETNQQNIYGSVQIIDS